MSDHRITELEIQLAHQSRSLEEMSDELHRQGREIDRLRAALQRLLDRGEDGPEGAPPANQPPPHW